MPVILPDEAEALWLDLMTEDPEVLRPLLAPFPSESMSSFPVSSLVNSPKNKGPDCIEPAAILPLPLAGPSTGSELPISLWERAEVEVSEDP